MKTWHILGLTLALLACVYASNDGSAKSVELRNLALADPNGVISLNASGFRHYVNEAPRPYDVVIYFSSDNCKLCDTIYSEFSKVAQLYRENGATNAYKSGNERKRAVFFVKIHFSSSTQEIFNKFMLTSVPDIMISQPKMVSAASPEALKAYLKEFLWLMTPSDGVITSHKLLEYCNKKTGRNVEYREPIINLIFVLILLGGIGFAGFMAVYTFKSFFGNPRMWLFASLIVYFICMSGIVYNILHNVPFTSHDRKGNVEWMAQGFRTQLGAEGYIMSGSVTLAGILLILIVSKKGNSSTDRWIRLGLFVFFLMTVWFVEGAYRSKTGHYNPEFKPPSHYITGPVLADQGFSLNEMYNPK